MMYITQGLKRAVQVNGAGIATIDGERQRTWAEFAGRVAKLAGALQALGFKVGDRLAILALNHTAPMFHIADSQWHSGVTMQAGTHVFIPRFDPLETLKIIEQH